MKPRDFVSGWNEFWFDPISTAPLALFRIGFGLVVFFWSLSILPDITSFFTRQGILPSQPPYGGDLRGVWGVLGSFDGSAAAWTLAIALVVASLCLTLGLFAQVAALVAWVVVMSFERRNPFLFNSGDALIRILLFYLIFAPSSAALSLDRYLRDRGDFWRFPMRPAWPVRLLQIQFSTVYLIAVWTKVRGTTWNNGTAVSIALRITDLERFPVPGFITHSLLISNLFTFGTLVIELSLAILVWNRKLRPWVLLAGISLHLGIEYAIRVGFYGLAILSLYLIWVPPERVEAIALAVRRRLSRAPAAAAPSVAG